MNLILVAVMFLAADNARELFERGAAKMAESGKLAQDGKFGQATELMQAAMADFDSAVAMEPDTIELRAKRGVMYGSFPPYLNKSDVARADLEWVAQHATFGSLTEAQRQRVLGMIARLRSTEKPDRFAGVPKETSPVIAAASISFKPSLQPGGGYPEYFANMVKQLENYPGLLGKHVVASVDHPGMFIVFTWWKDKQALNAWFYGDLHQGWMRSRGDAMSGKRAVGAEEVPSQVAMEVFAGLPGGVQVNGGFIPRELFGAGH